MQLKDKLIPLLCAKLINCSRNCARWSGKWAHKLLTFLYNLTIIHRQSEMCIQKAIFTVQKRTINAHYTVTLICKTLTSQVKQRLFIGASLWQMIHLTWTLPSYQSTHYYFFLLHNLAGLYTVIWLREPFMCASQYFLMFHTLSNCPTEKTRIAIVK